MVFDLHTWLYDIMGVDKNFFFGPILTTVLPTVFWIGLFLNEVPFDLKIFNTTRT